MNFYEMNIEMFENHFKIIDSYIHNMKWKHEEQQNFIFWKHIDFHFDCQHNLNSLFFFHHIALKIRWTLLIISTKSIALSWANSLSPFTFQLLLCLHIHHAKWVLLIFNFFRYIIDQRMLFSSWLKANCTFWILF